MNGRCVAQVLPCPHDHRDCHSFVDCPFSHVTENAKRRDPFAVEYFSTPCPLFDGGTCAFGALPSAHSQMFD